MPFRVAISKRTGGYSYIGPFDREYLSKHAAEIEIREDCMYETGEKEVQVWCRWHQRWERRVIEDDVVKTILYIRLRGLEETVEGASVIRESESVEPAK